MVLRERRKLLEAIYLSRNRTQMLLNLVFVYKCIACEWKPHYTVACFFFTFMNVIGLGYWDCRSLSQIVRHYYSSEID